jgi:hypothetical protein
LAIATGAMRRQDNNRETHYSAQILPTWPPALSLCASMPSAISCYDEMTFIDRFKNLAVPFRQREFALPRGEQFLQLMLSDPTGLGVELNFIVPPS